MTKNEFTELFGMILAGWPTQRQKLSPADERAMTIIYAAGLEDLVYMTARQAVVRLVRTAKFLPTVAEIREEAGIMVHGHLSTGVEAWGPVHRAIGSYGSHRTPGVDFHFDDPLTTLVVSSLGWLALCSAEHDAMPHYRARFIDAYEKLADEERTELLASRNVGAHKNALATPAPKHQVPTAPVAELPSPDERSQILRDVIRAEAPQHLKDLMPNLAKPAEPEQLVCDCERLFGIQCPATGMPDLCANCGLPVIATH